MRCFSSAEVAPEAEAALPGDVSAWAAAVGVLAGLVDRFVAGFAAGREVGVPADVFLGVAPFIAGEAVSGRFPLRCVESALGLTGTCHSNSVLGFATKSVSADAPSSRIPRAICTA